MSDHILDHLLVFGATALILAAMMVPHFVYH